MAPPSLVPVLLSTLPGLLAAGIVVATRHRVDGALSPRATRLAYGAAGVGVALLFAGPLLTLYTLWTTVGVLAAPAPGAAGFDAARWATTLGGAGVLVGVALLALGQYRASA